MTRTCGLVLSSFLLVAQANQTDAAELKLRIVDAETGALVPARLHVKDESGQFVVARDALMFGGDCNMSDAGAGFTNLQRALAGFTDRLTNPYTRTLQFYTAGAATVEVAAGTVEVAVYKGPEYRIGRARIDVPTTGIEHEIRLERWIDMPAAGWYSADDHLHIQRPHADLDEIIHKHMQAEDIHVANLLQMGKVRNFAIAPQYAFGPSGHYQRGNHILAAGQENPRTHYLGHTITLGAPEPVFDAKRYLIYRLIWEATSTAGGINGFAHAGFESVVSPNAGLAVVMPHDLLHFLEVLQFNRAGYQIWYDVLNLGARVTPTAGTDYPCVDQNIPGHERFYTRVDGELTYAAWLAAVRAGRTFVTTGPMLDFEVGGRGIGDELVLDSPARVRVRGRVRFDPERDDVLVLDVVQNGALVHTARRTENAPYIAIDTEVEVVETSWFALRAVGGERSWSGSATPRHFSMLGPTSHAHTGAIYVTLKDAPGLASSERARRVARAFHARLLALERTLAESNLEVLAASLETPESDGVPTTTLRENRDALLAEIATAKAYFAARMD